MSNNKSESKEEEVMGLDDDAGEITLVSQEKKEFNVDKKHASISKLVKTTLEGEPTETRVETQSVKTRALEAIVEYMNHHKGVEPDIVEKPLRSKRMKDVVKDPWDADFIDKIGDDRQHLYDVILAANYMDIQSLLHLGCAKVASLIKGQPLDKIKEVLEGKSGGGKAAASANNNTSSTSSAKEEVKKDA
eukprot:TRINITY_DN67718_c7_g9_i1.p1 TRINITY_DN67718_c7_g9~~TRINITY_DN67718_c7_g9_i1.p1  ORF type:complete len:190 (+),score=120.47 TRINITY_DN67718_c7_g9_i1:135-704(+)